VSTYVWGLLGFKRSCEYKRGKKLIQKIITENILARHWWLMSVILATQETVVQSQPGQIFHETLYQKKKKNTSQKKGAGGGLKV
jgi:hypothetical protein